MNNAEDGKLDSSIRSQKPLNPYDNPLYIERNINNQFERTYLAQVIPSSRGLLTLIASRCDQGQ